MVAKKYEYFEESDCAEDGVYSSEMFTFCVVDACNDDVYIKDEFDLFMSLDEDLGLGEVTFGDGEIYFGEEDIDSEIPEIKEAFERIGVDTEFGYSSFRGKRNGRTNEEIINEFTECGWKEDSDLYEFSGHEGNE